jgi:uncharacterized membrane protein (GlpM family)
MLKFISYFIIGGFVVSLSTYFGSKGHGFIAAFISMFPSMSVLIFSLLYLSGGRPSVIGYAKSLVYVVPPWILYVLTVTLLCERIGIWLSLAVGITLYLTASVGLSYFK